tara:strand:- start:5527 stop:6582 length:1056 start_codon:yes stop_codon:yes gene_type:complete
MKLLITTQKVDIDDPILGFFHNWIIEFAKHFDKIVVICLYEGAHSLPENVDVYSLGKEKGSSKLQRITRFRKYTKDLRDEYDVVFTHMNPEYIALGGLFWRRHNKKIYLWYTHRKVNIWLRIATLLSNKIFTASSKSFRLKSKNVRVVGHGIDTGFFVPGNKERTIPLITVGRISPIKHLEVAIEGVSILHNDVKDFSYTILGMEKADSKPKYLAELIKRAEESGLTQKMIIRFAYAEPQKIMRDEYLQKSEIFVHTSETGSLDKAVLEAMSCGVIPITSSEAFYDLLDEYKDLLIFKKGDPKDLARKIEILLAMDEVEKEKIRKSLREKIVRDHNLNKLIENLSTEMKIQ